MIPLRLAVFGITVVVTLGYAIYKHYRERPQPQHYGPPNGAERPTDEYTLPSWGTAETRKRRKPTGDDLCSICLGSVVNFAKRVNLLKCGHAFHENCIGTWLTTNSTCPNCRLEISK